MKLSGVRLAGVVALAPIAMLGLGFAAKPLYDTFCRVTGYGGTTQRAQTVSTRVLDQEVIVRFDANVAADAPLRFAPRQGAQRLRIGETGLAFYEVTNLSDAPVKAIAAYNVAPFKAGGFFQKLECFCFQEQTFAPGETVELPVIFFVDPEIVHAPGGDKISTITLSYTYYRAGSAAGPGAQSS